MNGMPFRVDGQGRVLLSWMSRNKAYWSLSEPGAGRFRPRVAAPRQGEAEDRYPLALANRKGEVLLIWLHGSKEVRWARYSLDGRFSGQEGRAGTLPTGNKPTAFVGPDDDFYIVF